jgi:glycosyltransferase involved in cell wall biosynthesis
MRILMTTDTIGGVWTYTIDLIKGLEKYNVEVILATMGGPLSNSQLAQVRKLKKVILDASNYKLEWMEDPWKDLERAHRWLLQLSFTFNPDVIHFNSYSFDGKLFNAPVVVVGHSCVLSWWQAVKNESAPPDWQRYADLVKRGLHTADVVIAPSHTMMMYLIDIYGDFKRAQVIYNSGDEMYFKPGSKEKIVFCMGRLWDEAKNLKLITEAANDIPYPIFIAGDRKKSGPSKNASNLHFLGKLDKKDVARWLSIAGVYALPAYYEPFGLSILEAAYSGCALVLGKIDSLQEIWKDSALYCDPSNKKEFANQVNTLMENNEMRLKYSQRAFKRSAEFKLAGMAGAYFSLYNSLLGAPWTIPEKKPSSPSTIKYGL